MDSRTMRAYDCDDQYPENPVLRCSLDANHNGRHEAWTDDTPRAPRLLASWDRNDEDDALVPVAAGLAAFDRATLHKPYIMPRVTR